MQIYAQSKLPEPCYMLTRALTSKIARSYFSIHLEKVRDYNILLGGYFKKCNCHLNSKFIFHNSLDSFDKVLNKYKDMPFDSIVNIKYFTMDGTYEDNTYVISMFDVVPSGYLLTLFYKRKGTDWILVNYETANVDFYRGTGAVVPVNRKLYSQ